MAVRAALPADVGELGRLRLALQREVDDLPEGIDSAPVADALRRYFEDTLPSGAFRAWVAEAGGRLVACSGLVLFRRPPSRRNPDGWEAYLMNMYTEPTWRGRGLATALLRACVAYTRSQTPARRIRLHATAAGRRVYERAGFVPATASVPELVLSWYRRGPQSPPASFAPGPAPMLAATRTSGGGAGATYDLQEQELSLRPALPDEEGRVRALLQLRRQETQAGEPA